MPARAGEECWRSRLCCSSSVTVLVEKAVDPDLVELEHCERRGERELAGSQEHDLAAVVWAELLYRVRVL